MRSPEKAQTERLFAQKALAIVKAAGMDPKSMDLELFRKSSVVVFSRAYCAIYKERLVKSPEEYMSRQEQILNCQLVIDGLLSKTNHPALTEITGEDVFHGVHKAIGILVSIMFAEGQRLWMEKVSDQRNVGGDTKQQSSANQPSLYRHEDESQSLAKFEKEHLKHDQKAYVDVPVLESNRFHQNNVSPRELEGLLSRISLLEGQLNQKNAPTKSKRKKSKKGLLFKYSKARDDAPDIPRSGNDIEEYDVRSSLSFGSNQKMNDQPQLLTNLNYINRENSDNYIKRNNTGLSKNKSQPSSAPGVRRENVSSRLYSAAPPNAVNANPMHLRYKEDKIPAIIKFDPTTHTFDVRSGRCILISKSEQIVEEMRRNRDALKYLKDEDDYMAGGGSPKSGLHAPIQPRWPGKSTGNSVTSWLKKVHEARLEEKSKARHVAAASHVDKSMVSDAPTLPASPQVFGAYQKLDQLDMVFSAEHCWNCEHHNTHTRHDPQVYCAQSEKFLRILSQTAHECRVQARVGVCRLQADVKPTSKMSDKDSRMGACELQVAFRSASGAISVEVLHSKLVSQRWPSKSVVEKRLLAFMSKHEVPTYTPQDDEEEGDVQPSDEVEMGTDSAEPYPIGQAHWLQTPLANPTWHFAPKEKGKVQNILFTLLQIKFPTFSCNPSSCLPIYLLFFFCIYLNQ